ncbi:hypothetical protein KYB31_06825 [Clostridium felsineum]|uniref:hypothetical protein n=1 Tax=Clostridium felsineum TaxID=36839 RepID=UPI00214DCD17|nr:hypothetical protein [Clostridium felsineum]MCR3758708.1 hypothetical protein [Clostridium felsineum]
MLNSNNIEDIKEIRKYLDENIYSIIYKEISGDLNYFFNPFPKLDSVKNNMMRFNTKIRKIYELFLLGCEDDYDILCDILGEKIILALLRVGFLINKNNRILSDGYSIVAYLDYYFVVATPNYYINAGKNQEIYIGMDSYRLTNILPHRESYHNFLDLCTGSGIQAIV